MAYLGQGTAGQAIIMGASAFSFEQDSPDIVTNSSTGNYSMASTVNNSLIIHTAGGHATYQLPSAASRYTFIFIHRGVTPSTPALNEIRIQPNSSDNLYFNNQLSENPGYLAITRRGSAMRVYTIDAVTWIAETITYPDRYKNDDRLDTKSPYYLTGRDSWTTKATGGTARRVLGSCSLNGYGYIFGGDAGTETNQYRDSADTWATKATLPVGKDTSGMSLNGFAYAVAGEDGAAATATVYKYNDTGNSWSSASSIGTATRRAGAGSLNGYGYVIGGRNTGGTVLSTVQKYNDNLDSWGSASSLPTAEEWITAVTGDGYIYTQLSEGATNVTYQYDDSANVWLSRAILSATRSEGAGFYNNGYTAFVGGFNGSNVGTNDLYDVYKNTFTTKTADTARRTQAGFGLQGYGYICNGFTSSAVNTVTQYN